MRVIRALSVQPTSSNTRLTSEKPRYCPQKAVIYTSSFPVYWQLLDLSPNPLTIQSLTRVRSSEIRATLASNSRLDHFGFKYSTVYPQPWQLSWLKKDNSSFTYAQPPIFVTKVPATEIETLFTSTSAPPPTSVTRFSDLPVWPYPQKKSYCMTSPILYQPDIGQYSLRELLGVLSRLV